MSGAVLFCKFAARPRRAKIQGIKKRRDLMEGVAPDALLHYGNKVNYIPA